MKTDHSLKIQIKRAIRDVWPLLPEVFYGWKLSLEVGRLLLHDHRNIYADTIFRYARELKAEGAIDYDCIRSKSLYIKKEKP